MISQYFTRRILPLSLSTLPFRLAGALTCTPYYGKCRTKFPDKVLGVLNIDLAKRVTSISLVSPQAAMPSKSLGAARPAPKEGKGWLFAAGELAMTAAVKSANFLDDRYRVTQSATPSIAAVRMMPSFAFMMALATRGKALGYNLLSNLLPAFFKRAIKWQNA